MENSKYEFYKILFENFLHVDLVTKTDCSFSIKMIKCFKLWFILESIHTTKRMAAYNRDKK